MYLADVFTVSANLAGLPAVSVPCGFTTDRLPIGLQLTGQRSTRPRFSASQTPTNGTPDWWKKARRFPTPSRSANRSSYSGSSHPQMPTSDPSGQAPRREAARRSACAIWACRSPAPSSSSASREIERELEARGLAFRPHYWLSDEWFTPDGVPGVAIPFYLAHPRLAKLELAQMLEVEGGDPESCLRILRHEAGHAIDNAYDMRRRPTRRRAVRHAGDDLPRVLHAEAVQQELRPASRSLVRAEPSGRGFRRDVRRVARSAVDVGDALRGLAGASASWSTWIG